MISEPEYANGLSLSCPVFIDRDADVDDFGPIFIGKETLPVEVERAFTDLSRIQSV